MNQKFRFSSTYLFKIHALKRALDKAFDGALRKHAGITLSLFTVLLAVSENEEINQRQVAAFLGISAVAVKRQVDLARARKFLKASTKSSGGGQALRLTEAGQSVVQAGISALGEHLRGLFDSESMQLGLMGHLDYLLSASEEAVRNCQ
jgi:DNA-binding MarR family transcriptional regulator